MLRVAFSQELPPFTHVLHRHHCFLVRVMKGKMRERWWWRFTSYFKFWSSRHGRDYLWPPTIHALVRINPWASWKDYISQPPLQQNETQSLSASQWDICSGMWPLPKGYPSYILELGHDGWSFSSLLRHEVTLRIGTTTSVGGPKDKMRQGLWGQQDCTSTAEPPSELLMCERKMNSVGWRHCSI